ncbi:hypothetical protein BN8_02610 [Fibrisoma limi BUZ 3]|uniref:Uncharacterized protein n=1 Tax=Fibrisoma limi BUZ 3 TaxID=1185876 RepID=I2GHY6_9BACT|nr:hypothetical protein BN8_02610 [Fibrisoma limi BUZ 3]
MMLALIRPYKKLLINAPLRANDPINALALQVPTV